MNLVVKIIGERVKTTRYAYTETESYTVAQVALDGTPDFVAKTLRALAETISPEVRHVPLVEGLAR